MNSQFTIVSTCRMGPGTFEAKFIPLAQIPQVGRIIVIRKEIGPAIPKLEYAILPRWCRIKLLNIIFTPLFIIKQVRKTNASFILAYHYVPHYYFAYLASLLTGIPYVLGQTGSDDQKLAAKPLAGAFLRMVIKRAKRLNVPGKSSLKYWNSLGFYNVEILHSSIDTDYFYPAEKSKEYDYLYLGRLEPYKGVHSIIQAFGVLQKGHSKIKLAIVGYGSQEASLKELVKSSGLDANVTFHGFQQDTRSWIYKARVFIMASETEGLPCALMEAMSCGMVCITSIVGNIGDILIDGETGFGFAPGEMNRMVELMAYSLEHEQELGELKARARKIIVMEHSFKKTISVWNSLLSEVV